MWLVRAASARGSLHLAPAWARTCWLSYTQLSGVGLGKAVFRGSQVMGRGLSAAHLVALPFIGKMPPRSRQRAVGRPLPPGSSAPQKGLIKAAWGMAPPPRSSYPTTWWSVAQEHSCGEFWGKVSWKQVQVGRGSWLVALAAVSEVRTLILLERAHWTSSPKQRHPSLYSKLWNVPAGIFFCPL